MVTQVKKTSREVAYGLHLMVRPFSGYWDLKHEKRGSFTAAVVIVLLLLLVVMAEYQFLGYFFMRRMVRENVNLLIELAQIAIPYALWVVSNWCLTTLMDGEGSMRDVAIATAYALVPMIVFNIPAIIISNFLALDEYAFMSILQNIGIFWSGVLIFASVVVTHQYTVPKTIITIILSVLGMVLLLFLSMLITSIMQQIITFFVAVYREAQYRLL